MTHRRVWASAAVFLALLSSACSSSDGDGASSATKTEPPTTTVTTKEPPATTTATRAPVVASGEGWIAFNPAVRGIGLIRADGTGRHVIRARGRVEWHDPDWSPDGSEIAYVQGGLPWILHVQGKHPRQLIKSIPADLDLKGRSWGAPAWSPDGSQVAIVGYGPPRGCCSKPLRSVLAAVEVATGKVTRVWEPPAGRLIRYPRWSPDGQAIVFTSDRFVCDQGCDAYRGSTVVVIRRRGGAWAAPKAITDVGRYGFADWHPTKDLILFAGNDPRWSTAFATRPTNLYVIRSDGSERTRLASFASTVRPSGPTWTADGRIIATLVKKNQFAKGIGLLNADGSGLTVVVPPENTEPNPRARAR